MAFGIHQSSGYYGVAEVGGRHFFQDIALLYLRDLGDKAGFLAAVLHQFGIAPKHGGGSREGQDRAAAVADLAALSFHFNGRAKLALLAFNVFFLIGALPKIHSAQKNGEQNDDASQNEVYFKHALFHFFFISSFLSEGRRCLPKVCRPTWNLPRFPCRRPKVYSI